MNARHEIIARGLSLIRGGQYAEAHERFEEAWRCALTDDARDDGQQRILMRALAQLCAAYHQLTLGRARASVRTWQKACDKLAKIGAHSSDYQRSVEAFWARLGISAEAPRLIAVAELPARDSWPRPDYLLALATSERA